MDKILITYASTSGSTQEIAEFIYKELAGLSLPVDLRPCQMVADLIGYTAVVLGMPLYMFHLHKDGLHFLKRHQKRLASMPAAIFAGGPFGENAERDTPGIRANLDSELEKLTWLHPVSVELVGGRFDPARLRFPFNLLPALKNMPASDLRDWDAIRTWARGLPALFGMTETTEKLSS